MKRCLLFFTFVPSFVLSCELFAISHCLCNSAEYFNIHFNYHLLLSRSLRLSLYVCVCFCLGFQFEHLWAFVYMHFIFLLVSSSFSTLNPIRSIAFIRSLPLALCRLSHQWFFCYLQQFCSSSNRAVQNREGERVRAKNTEHRTHFHSKMIHTTH